MSYLRQINSTDCGPAAVLNALQWSGRNFTRKSSYLDIKKRCRWKPGVGANFSDLVSTLKHYKVKVKKRVIVNLKTIDQGLEEGKSFILLYVWRKNGVDQGHFIFIPARTTKFYLACNERIKGDPVRKISRSKMNRRLRRRTRNGKKWQPLLLEVSG